MDKVSKNKLSIFFCINGLNKGGAEKQLSYISNHLSKIYDVHIFSLSRLSSTYKLNRNIKFYKYTGIFYFLYYIFKVIKIKPKAIFFILPKSYFFFGTLSILFPNIKKILMRRSLNYYHQNIFYKFYEIFLHFFTDLFITNSYAAKLDLVNDEFVKREKVKMVNNYIKNFNNNSIRTKRGKLFKILCISNFYEYKGHKLLLKSLSYLKNYNWQLYLVGEKRDFNKQTIINYSRKLDIEKKIYFKQKINSGFSFPNFSLGVLFSKTESFPNAIMEYLILKLPVAAYKTGDVNRMVNKDNGILFNTRNPFLLSKKIKKLLVDKDLKKKSLMSHSKIKRFSKKSNTLHKYLIILEKILCVE